jgi:hypothetical protein
MTSQDFGFAWSDPKEKRQKAILRWTEWYRNQVEQDPAAKGSQPIPSAIQ